MVGTRAYAAPEILSGGEGGRKALALGAAMQLDAYSMGCTLRHMLTGVPPNVSLMDAEQGMGCGCLGGPSPRIVWPQELSKEARELMEGLCKPDAQERLRVEQALSDWQPWLSKGGFIGKV